MSQFETGCDGPNDVAGCNAAVDRIKTTVEEIARMVAGIGRWGDTHVLWEEHYDKATRELRVKASMHGHGKSCLDLGTKLGPDVNEQRYAQGRRRLYNTLLLEALLTTAGEVRIVSSDGTLGYLHDLIRDGKFGPDRVADRVRAPEQGRVSLLPKRPDTVTCRLPYGRPRRKPIDLRPIVAEANQRWIMWHVGQWLERECPWLFEEVVDADDVTPLRGCKQVVEA